MNHYVISKMTMERDTSIDVMRGLCMLCVILEHSIPMSGLNKTILSFHMLAFYIISGLCYKSDVSLMIRVKKRLYGLGWQLLTFSVASILIHYFYSIVRNEQAILLWKAIIGIFFSDGLIGQSVALGFWFVQELLYVSIVYILLELLLGRIHTLTFFLVSFVILYIVSRQYNEFLLNLLCRIALGGVFYCLGALWGIRTFRKKKLNRWVYLLLGGIFLFITAMLAQKNSPVLMYCFSYGNIWIFFVTAITGCVSLYCISKFIEKNNILEYIGRNSISYLFVHFHVRIILLFFVANSYNGNTVWAIALFVVTVIMSTLFVVFVNQYAPWMTKIPKIIW